jgi:hypothetical protein
MKTIAALNRRKNTHRSENIIYTLYPQQSARIAYLSWKIEIGRDWYRSQIGRRLWAKVKLCTPVHGLSICLIAEKPESPCIGAHIFTFAHESRPIWLLYQSRPISIFQLK